MFGLEFFRSSTRSVSSVSSWTSIGGLLRVSTRRPAGKATRGSRVWRIRRPQNWVATDQRRIRGNEQARGERLLALRGGTKLQSTLHHGTILVRTGPGRQVAHCGRDVWPRAMRARRMFNSKTPEETGQTCRNILAVGGEFRSWRVDFGTSVFSPLMGAKRTRAPHSRIGAFDPSPGRRGPCAWPAQPGRRLLSVCRSEQGASRPMSPGAMRLGNPC